MKKVLSIAMAIFVVFATLFVPINKVYATASVTMKVSATTVNIGDTVTVTVSVPSNYGANGTISYDSSIFSAGSDSTKFIIGDAITDKDYQEFTFTAISAGNCTFSATVQAIGGLYDDDVSYGVSPVTVTVNNSAGGGDNGGSTDDSDKSSDNFLAGITLSAGTLSPAFKYTTTSYTASVPYEVTSLTVSASLSSQKATIESLSGGSDLKVGENTITIKVKAENGVSRTYTIIVTRRAEGEAAPDDSEDTADTDADPDNQDGLFESEGQQYTTAKEIPEEAIPQDFTLSEVTLGTTVFQSLKFDKGDLTLLYLRSSAAAADAGDSADADEDTDASDASADQGQLFIYDEAQGIVYPFVCLNSDAGYVIVLQPVAEEVPEGYTACSIPVENHGNITAYQQTEGTEDTVSFLDLFLPETVQAAELTGADLSDFYLIYCISDEGTTGWYRYDSVEGTYQRYFVQEGATEETVDEADTSEDNAALEYQYQSLRQDYNKLRQYSLLGAAGAALIILILIICLIATAAKHKKKREPEEIEVEELDDEEDLEDSDEDEVYDTEEDSDADYDAADDYDTAEDSDEAEDYDTDEDFDEAEDYDTAEDSDEAEDYDTDEDFDETEDYNAAEDKGEDDYDDIDDSEASDPPVRKPKFDTIDLTLLSQKIEEAVDAEPQDEEASPSASDDGDDSHSHSDQYPIDGDDSDDDNDDDASSQEDYPDDGDSSDDDDFEFIDL